MEIQQEVLDEALKTLAGFNQAWVTDVGTVAIEFGGSLASLDKFIVTRDIMAAITGRSDLVTDVAIVDSTFLLIFSVAD